MIGALLLTAGVYLVAGIVVGSAAYLPGSSIEQYEPIRWAELTREVERVSWATVWPHLPWLIGPLFILTSAAAVAAQAGRSSRQLRKAVRVVLFAGGLPAAMGAISVVFTVLNATVWGDLDGEYLNEFHPVMEAYCVAFIAASWSYWSALRRATAT